MSDDRPKSETMSIEEATVSNMWEIAAIVEVLERKGFRSEQDHYEIDCKVAWCLTIGQGACAPCTPEGSTHPNCRILNTHPHSCHRAHTRRGRGMS